MISGTSFRKRQIVCVQMYLSLQILRLRQSNDLACLVPLAPVNKSYLFEECSVKAKSMLNQNFGAVGACAWTYF